MKYPPLHGVREDNHTILSMKTISQDLIFSFILVGRYLPKCLFFHLYTGSTAHNFVIKFQHEWNEAIGFHTGIVQKASQKVVAANRDQLYAWLGFIIKTAAENMEGSLVRYLHGSVQKRSWLSVHHTEFYLHINIVVISRTYLPCCVMH